MKRLFFILCTCILVGCSNNTEELEEVVLPDTLVNMQTMYKESSDIFIANLIEMDNTSLFYLLQLFETTNIVEEVFINESLYQITDSNNKIWEIDLNIKNNKIIEFNVKEVVLSEN